MMKLSVKATALVSALLLSACTTVSTPTGPAEVLSEPTMPTALSPDLSDTPNVAVRAATTAMTLFDPKSTDMPAEVREVFSAVDALLGRPSGTTTFGSLAALDPRRLTVADPTALGRALRDSALSGLGESRSDTRVPRGTFRMMGTREVRVSTSPTDGYILKSQDEKTVLNVSWEVGGRRTQIIEMYRLTFGDTTHVSTVELPTNASATLSVNGQVRASGLLTAAYGDCFSTLGPDSFDLKVWAGNEANPAAKLDVSYLWDASGITSVASASYRAGAHVVAADLKADVDATTVREGCDNTKVVVTPRRVDVSLDARVDLDSFKVVLGARDLTGVVFSGENLRKTTPFASVTGTLAGSADLNDRRTMAMYGDLRDGNANLVPGDGVKVAFVMNGKLRQTNLEQVLRNGLY